jgi:hypothetical protein
MPAAFWTRAIQRACRRTWCAPAFYTFIRHL